MLRISQSSGEKLFTFIIILAIAYNFINSMWDMPFEAETGEYDSDGNMIIKYDYFGEWDLEEQIDFCESNDYLFNKYGKLVGHLEEVEV